MARQWSSQLGACARCLVIEASTQQANGGHQTLDSWILFVVRNTLYPVNFETHPTS